MVTISQPILTISVFPLMSMGNFPKALLEATPKCSFGLIANKTK